MAYPSRTSTRDTTVGKGGQGGIGPAPLGTPDGRQNGPREAPKRAPKERRGAPRGATGTGPVAPTRLHSHTERLKNVPTPLNAAEGSNTSRETERRPHASLGRSGALSKGIKRRMLTKDEVRRYRARPSRPNCRKGRKKDNAQASNGGLDRRGSRHSRQTDRESGGGVKGRREKARW